MKSVVVDTNVPVVANGQSHPSGRCVAACARRLLGVTRGEEQLAIAHGGSPPILEATDAGWWRHRRALAKASVTVEFLCPEEMHGEDKRRSARTTRRKRRR